MASLDAINGLDREAFVALVGPVFEHSPWIAERTWARRPFATVEELHRELVATVRAASPEEQLALIRAHPDLVGRAAMAGTLTPESTREQGVAGLDELDPHEIALFDRYNAAYRERFGFPFVICARESRKETILGAFPERLENARATEVDTALTEIGKIAWYRLNELIDDDS